MKSRFQQQLLCLAATAALIATPALAKGPDDLRPPSVPLVACDPYFSIWSPADKLTDADTTHWTGKPQRLASLVRVDGKAYRLMGSDPAGVAAMPQVELQVLPTRTIYSFEGAGIHLSLTFMTPALPEDIDLLSRPVTYLTWEARSADGKKHAVEVYFDASSELTVNEPQQLVTHSSKSIGNLDVIEIGSVEQDVLGKRGDDIRIDWGYLYVAAPKAALSAKAVISRDSQAAAFIKSGAKLAGESVPAQARGNSLVGAVTFDLGQVGSKPVSTWLILAYDDLYSIQYMKKNLRPDWRRNGWEASDLLLASAKDYSSLKKRCEKMDVELMKDLGKAGGQKYAKLAALAYRQCFAAGKFAADSNGQPLQFSKENHSNGCIGTSDVFYPMAPQFLLFGPSLAKSFIVPFMNYAASEYWKFDYAPHDLGTYPIANGQVYGGGETSEENQMPVEESGNMLILFGAVAEMEGNAKFAGLYWPQLERWAEYLKAKGFDPENQLCTDDFAGHLAHNVNLSAKAICGLASFAKLCEMRGDKAKAAEYSQLARGFVERWLKEADSGDHYRLAFDRPDTWSQKYNATWDRILGLNLWPAGTWRKEMDYYKRIQNKYGLPLDNRKAYTKLDWILWTATLTQERADFEALVDPVFRFLNEAPDRSPMTDWYRTTDAHKIGFTARPVVGGVYLQMLYDARGWKKWARRDETKASGWAPLPKRPVIVSVIPAADRAPAQWSYATSFPGENWFQVGYDDAGWRRGQSGFGTRDTPGAVVGTTWNSTDIWLRRVITISAEQLNDLKVWLHHDEDAEIYVNGVLALKTGGFTSTYDVFELTHEGKAALKPGENLIAIHCRQSTGGQYVDLGFARVHVQ